MSDLRSVSWTGRTAGHAAAVAAVVLTATGACWAAATTTSAPTIPRSPLLRDSNTDVTGLMWHMLAAALIVLTIGFLAFFVIRKLLPRISRASGKRISVLETKYLGPRKAVHLLQVGSVKLLVASSPDGVVRLDDVTGAFPPEYADLARGIGTETHAVDQDGDKLVDQRETHSNAQ